MKRHLRKIIEIRGSYYISLPKEWVKGFSLSKGSYLEVSIDQLGNLTIKPAERPSRKPYRKVSITADDHVDSKIVIAYLSGYDQIEVVKGGGISRNIRRKIEDVTSLLIGLEIVSESVDRIVLECLPVDVVDVWKFIKRMDSIARSMYIDSFRALANRDNEIALSVIERDSKVDKLYFLVVRMIRSSLMDLRTLIDKGLSPLELLDYRLMSRDLEEIADNAESMARNVLNVISRPSRDYEECLDEIEQIVLSMDNIERDIMEIYEKRLFHASMNIRNRLMKPREQLRRLMDMCIEERRYVSLLPVVNDMSRILSLIADLNDLVAR